MFFCPVFRCMYVVCVTARLCVLMARDTVGGRDLPYFREFDALVWEWTCGTYSEGGMD